MPDDFAWGFSLPAVGCEGAAPASDWARFERDGRVPASFDGNGWLTNFGDDIAMYAAAGCRALRIGAEWARIEPQAGVVNGEAVDVYREMLRVCAAAGIDVWLTLHDTALPGWFADDERGFRDERSRRYYWLRHVDRCAEFFEGAVHGFVPIDDPVGYVLRGFWRGMYPPGRRDLDATREAFLGIVDALAQAQRLLSGVPTMVVVGLSDPHGRRNRGLDSPRTAWAFLEARTTGRLEIADLPTLEVPTLMGAGTVVGIRHFARDSGAEELADCVYRAAELAPDSDLYIASNGCRTADDDGRDAYLVDVAGRLTTLARERVPLRGYFHHTGVDCYDWHRGFTVPNGVFTRDRVPRNSAARLRDIGI